MFKRTVVILGASLVLLTGCGEVEKSEPAVLSSQVEKGDGQPVSKTAIYFPGGAGVDFGRNPTSDRVIKYQSNDVRIIRYEFEESIDVVDKALRGVLELEGYVSSVKPEEQYDLTVLFRKSNTTTLLARYKIAVREGFDKKTVLELSWWL